MLGSPDKVLNDLVEAKNFEQGEMDMSSGDERENGADHDQTINSLMEEIKELKRQLEESEKKCFAAEKLFELKKNDDGYLKLDEENRRVKDQLKWKMEQFKHLEEAHENLKDEFLMGRKEWEVARSALVEEVSELKTRVESKTRISNELQTRLGLCSQALEHEESKIKTLEAELAESKAFYQKSFAGCQDAKSELENLMMCRDEEIASLKSSLAEKEAMCKEYEYISRKIEHENQELMASIKDLQEAQIQGASSSSSSSTVSRVKSKLKNVEQKHKVKEAEWSCKVDKLADELNGSKSELELKDAAIKELSSKLEGLEKAHMKCSSNLKIKDDQLLSELERMTAQPSKSSLELEAKEDSIITELKMELEECHSSIMQLKVENEETSLILSAYKKGFAELQIKMESQEAENEKLSREREMEMESDLKAQRDALQEELERHKGMVMEISEKERYWKERMQEVWDALEKADAELAEARCKESETEFELESWKALAERLQSRLVECQQMRKQVEHSLLEEVEMEEKLKQEIDCAKRMLEEKERIMDELQKEKMALYEDVMKLSTEREKLMDNIGGMCDRIRECSNEDRQLMGILGNMMRNVDNPEPQMDLAGNDDKFNLLKENLNINISPTIKKFEILSKGGRSPFQEITTNPQLHLGAST